MKKYFKIGLYVLLFILIFFVTQIGLSTFENKWISIIVNTSIHAVSITCLVILYVYAKRTIETLSHFKDILQMYQAWNDNKNSVKNEKPN